jgi:hypothetical protein
MGKVIVLRNGHCRTPYHQVIHPVLQYDCEIRRSDSDRNKLDQPDRPTGLVWFGLDRVGGGSVWFGWFTKPYSTTLGFNDGSSKVPRKLSSDVERSCLSEFRYTVSREHSCGLVHLSSVGSRVTPSGCTTLYFRLRLPGTLGTYTSRV